MPRARSKATSSLTKPPISRDTRKWAEVANAISGFAREVSALRDFFTTLSPLIATVTAERKQTLSDSVQKAIRTQLDPLPVEERIPALEELTGALVAIAELSESNDSAGITMQITSRATAEILKVMQRAMAPVRHQGILNNSILISLVTVTEVLIANLLHARFNLFPGAVPSAKTLSVEELRSADSVESAIRMVVDDEVESVMRASAERWAKYLNDHGVRLDRGALPNKAQWIECIQRRHIIIHNGGLTNQLYLRNVQWDEVTHPQKRPSPGELLVVSDDYLLMALDLLEATGVLIGASAWQSWISDSEADAHSELRKLVHDLSFEHLTNGNWRVASYLTDWLEHEASANEGDRLASKFNRLQALKRMGEVESVRAELDMLDTTTLSLNFLLAHAALLDLDDYFLSLLPRALDAEQISPEAIRTWPIFLEMRSDPRVEAAVRSYERRQKRRSRGPAAPKAPTPGKGEPAAPVREG